MTQPIEGKELHHELIVIDGHCDSLLDQVGVAYDLGKEGTRDLLVDSGASESRIQAQGHLDIPRLLQGGVTCQTFALYVDNKLLEVATEHSHRLIDALEDLCERSDSLQQVFCAADIRRTKAEGKVAALLSIEGGEAIGTSLDGLRSFYGRGVRMMGLTWSRRNALGRGVQVEGSDGLTDFGKSVIAEMERLGMILDVSHLSDEAFEDALAVAHRPLVASHSNSRVLCPHPRNLTDAQAERIAATGGLIGLCFAGVFIDQEAAKVNFQRLMDHLDHLLSVVGPEHVGLGSDFDGFTAPYGIAIGGCDELPKITEHLLEKGWSTPDIASVMGGNWLRVIQEVVG